MRFIQKKNTKKHKTTMAQQQTQDGFSIKVGQLWKRNGLPEIFRVAEFIPYYGRNGPLLSVDDSMPMKSYEHRKVDYVVLMCVRPEEIDNTFVLPTSLFSFLVTVDDMMSLDRMTNFKEGHVHVLTSSNWQLFRDVQKKMQ
jgi:hypothetical protein